MSPRRIVLSGCSGGGKSTLLAEMARRGYVTVPEPGRRIVTRQRELAETALPWVNPEAFARAAIEMAISDFESVQGDPVLFDRSALDALIWFDRSGTTLDAAKRQQILGLGYDRRVLLVPPWPEIYQMDADRQHGLEDALAEYRSLCDRLPNYGFDTETVPKASVADRADWLEGWLVQTRGDT